MAFYAMTATVTILAIIFMAIVIHQDRKAKHQATK